MDAPVVDTPDSSGPANSSPADSATPLNLTLQEHRDQVSREAVKSIYRSSTLGASLFYALKELKEDHPELPLSTLEEIMKLFDSEITSAFEQVSNDSTISGDLANYRGFDGVWDIISQNITLSMNSGDVVDTDLAAIIGIQLDQKKAGRGRGTKKSKKADA